MMADGGMVIILDKDMATEAVRDLTIIMLRGDIMVIAVTEIETDMTIEIMAMKIKNHLQLKSILAMMKNTN